ncbi:Protein kinase-like domain containing protein [Naviculisporaceae sp. PSN 640]
MGYIDDDGAYIVELIEKGPVTPFGTYLYGPIGHGLEPLEQYEPGGYHPVDLNIFLGPNDRYQVLHKLGHSDRATVWLCRDWRQDPSKYVALKIMKASIQEENIMEHNFDPRYLDLGAPGGEYLEVLLSKFTLEGPNGTHHCMTFPVYGPMISPGLWIEWGEARDEEAPSVLNKLAYKATQALAFLHDNGICHGDFRPENIRTLIRGLGSMTRDQVLQLFGRPRTVDVRWGPRVEDDGIERDPSSQPRELVHAYNSGCLATNPLPAQHISDSIVVSGLGKAYWADSPPAWEDLETMQGFLPPELQFGFESAELPPNSIGFTSDLWALGYTLTGIRTQKKIFTGAYQDPDAILVEAVWHFGWANRDTWFEESGKLLDDIIARAQQEGAEDETIARLSQVDGTLECDIAKPAQYDDRTLEISAREAELLSDLVRKLCRYESRKRLSAKKALNHQFFKYYEE